MAENTKETIWTTKKKDMVFSHGQMAVNMMANGSMVNKTGLVYILPKKVSLEKVNGKTESVFNGFEQSDLILHFDLNLLKIT
jgi:hypothetical protein